MGARSHLVRCLSLVLLSGLVSTAQAAAQTGLATVTGLVSDPSAAALPGVTVTATNQATSIAYTGTTNDAGNYVITSVPIGEYVILAALPGFKGVQAKVTLSVAQTARVDFKMEVGNVEETVDVIATGAILQTENAVVGTTANREQIEKLPAVGRNVSSVTLFVPGVTQPNMSSFNSLSGGGRPYVNGQLQQANNFTIDGVDTNEAINNGIAYQPSPDAVEQVSVETNNYSAELGNVTGALVNMVIKSGTNEIRGNGFYYWRDNSLAATPWATNRAGGTKSEYSRDIFGGTVGGPLLRNKLFFFADYQGGRQETPPSNAFATVVPDAWRQGDLSSLLARGHRRPRSGDAAAVSEQPDPRRPVQRVRAQPVRERVALSARQRRAAAQRLPRELSRHHRIEGGRRPVRRQAGLERLLEGQAVRALLEANGRDRHLANASCRCSSRRRPPIRRGAWRRTGTASSAAAIVNDLLVGYSRNDALSAELDPLGSRQPEQPARHSRRSDHPRSDPDSDGRHAHEHRQPGDRHRQLQPGVSAQRAADMAPRPSHA